MAQEAQSLRELIGAAADALGVTGTVTCSEAGRLRRCSCCPKRSTCS